MGSNQEAARLSGVNVNRVVMFAYIASSAGWPHRLRADVAFVTAQPNEGVMYELDAIAAAVIGGTSLSGGVGTVSGTLIGSFVIGIPRNGLNMNGVSAFTQQIIIGLVILLYRLDRPTPATAAEHAKTHPHAKPLRQALPLVSIAVLPIAAQAGEIAVIVKTTNSTFWQTSTRAPRRPSSRSSGPR